MKSKKICNFHVSDFHLITAVLPYINEKIKEEKRDYSNFTKKDLTGEVKKYLKSVKSFECEREKIMNIGWRKNKKELSLEKFSNKTIFVIGNREFVEEINNTFDKEDIFEIVNCYNINNGIDINEIIKEYSFILTTEGVKTVNTKNSQNAQKRKTIKSQL